MRRFCPHCGERLERDTTRRGIPSVGDDVFEVAGAFVEDVFHELCLEAETAEVLGDLVRDGLVDEEGPLCHEWLPSVVGVGPEVFGAVLRLLDGPLALLADFFETVGVFLDPQQSGVDVGQLDVELPCEPLGVEAVAFVESVVDFSDGDTGAADVWLLVAVVDDATAGLLTHRVEVRW
jgi:hypothetical protein